MPWVGFEPTISAGERPKTYALDRTATGTGITEYYYYFLWFDSPSGPRPPHYREFTITLRHAIFGTSPLDE